MRTPFVAGNWKMNTTASEARDILCSLKQSLLNVHLVDTAICPPFPYLLLASEILKGSRIQLGAQNMYWEEEGAFTGEVSPLMLKDVGCNYVILGHSERRRYFGETDESVNRKIRMALDSGLRPIVCVGERLEERQENETERVISDQVKGCLKGLPAEDMQQITIAYEPVWAIGTGKTATTQQAQEVHRFIRQWIGKTFDQETADTVRIQYGGSVKPDNAGALMAQQDIDGALVGGASLKQENFSAIVKSCISDRS